MSPSVTETRVQPCTDWSITKTRNEVIGDVSNALRNANGEGLIIPLDLVRIIVDCVHVTVPNQNIFTGRDWQAAIGESVRMPPLPDDIEAELQRKCPFDPENKKTVAETHILVGIPSEVSDMPFAFAIDDMELCAKRIRNVGFQSFLNFHDEEVKRKHKWAPMEAGWFLMTTDVVEGSRGKRYEEQQELIAKNRGWEVPSLKYAVACIFANFIKNNRRTFTSGFPWTYTRCIEQYGGFHIGVGGFSPDGLEVFDANPVDDESGVAGFRKFLVSRRPSET